MNTVGTNEATVRAWLDRASGKQLFQNVNLLEKRQSTLAFCVDLEHVRDLTDTFRRYGVDARCVTSKTKGRTPLGQTDY